MDTACMWRVNPNATERVIPKGSCAPWRQAAEEKQRLGTEHVATNMTRQSYPSASWGQPQGS